jgi:EpsI family protein
LKQTRSVDWRQVGFAAIALILAAIAYRMLFETSSSLDLEEDVETLFFHSTASGPPVVLFVAAWFLYRRWPRLAKLPRRFAWGPGLGLLVPCLLLYAWATYTGASDLLIGALMLNLLGCGALLWGAPALRVLAFPTAFLFLGMRIPAVLLNKILWALQLWTAEITGFTLRLIGQPAFVAGDQILLPDQNFAIIETCAGLRSCESLTILAFLMVDLFERRGLHAALLLVSAPIVAFGVNGLRAVTLVLNPHSEVAEIHTLQGIAMLLVGLLIIYGLDIWLEKLLGRRRPRARSRAAPKAAPARNSRLAGPLVANAALVGLVVLSVATPRWEAPARGSLPFPDEQIPKQLDAWTSTARTTDQSFLGIVRFRARVDRVYKRDGKAVELFVGVGSRNARLASPFSPKTAFPGSGWWREQSRQIVLEPDGRPARLSVVRYGSGGRRKLVIDWTEGGEGLAAETLRYVTALDNSRWSRSREGVSVRIATSLRSSSPAGQAAAEALLLDFYRSVKPKLDVVGYVVGSQAASRTKREAAPAA